MQKIHPMLWFDNQAEEAAKHYVPIFPNSKLGTITKYGPAGPLAEGTVMTVDFELDAKAGSADPDHGWHEWPQGPRGHRAAGRLVELGWPWETVYREPYETLRRHCETIGRRFEDIVLTAGVEGRCQMTLRPFSRRMSTASTPAPSSTSSDQPRLMRSASLNSWWMSG